MADPVEPGYGAYLQAQARYVSATVAGSLATWGDKSFTSTVMSPIALKADAQAEAIRQAQFLAGPIARDRHVVPGAKAYLIGRPIIITADRAGYESGATVFVIGAAEEGGTTTLTVLKRL